jgi:hypothetical protein
MEAASGIFDLACALVGRQAPGGWTPASVGSVLQTFGLGKLVNSPLFESGVTVAMPASACAAAASLSIAPLCRTASAFRSNVQSGIADLDIAHRFLRRSISG